MEEGLFPGSQSIFGPLEEMEEERRLAYVAITRAKKQLYITNAGTRMIYGSTSRNRPSRFVGEIPHTLCEETRQKQMGYDWQKPTTPVASSSKNYSYSDVFSRPQPPKKPDVSGLQYSAGTRVEHSTFGEGLIIKVTPMGNDAMLEIAFDTVGTKKIMAGYARLKVLND